jgi:hypothetical protein
MEAALTRSSEYRRVGGGGARRWERRLSLECMVDGAGGAESDKGMAEPEV